MQAGKSKGVYISSFMSEVWRKPPGAPHLKTFIFNLKICLKHLLHMTYFFLEKKIIQLSFSTFTFGTFCHKNLKTFCHGFSSLIDRHFV